MGPAPAADLEDGTRVQSYDVGDVIYWSPSAHVAIFYRHDGRGNRLPIMTIKDCDVSAGRPIDHVANVVALHPRSILRDRPRWLAPFLPAEQVVHRQGQRQQRDEVPRRLAVDQVGVRGSCSRPGCSTSWCSSAGPTPGQAEARAEARPSSWRFYDVLPDHPVSLRALRLERSESADFNQAAPRQGSAIPKPPGCPAPRPPGGQPSADRGNDRRAAAGGHERRPDRRDVSGQRRRVEDLAFGTEESRQASPGHPANIGCGAPPD